MEREIRIALHQMNYTTGDFEGNFLSTRASIAANADAHIHVLPECAVTNYPSDDLYLDKGFIAKAAEYCGRYRELSAEMRTTIVVGSPVDTGGSKPCNGLLVYRDGQEVLRYNKTHLPNYGVFDDVRWFESRLGQHGKDRWILPLAFEADGAVVKLGFCICEDIWFSDVTDELAAKGAEIIVSINSSPYAIAKGNFRRGVFGERVRETGLPLVYVNQVGGNDELVWDGASAVLDPDGRIFEMEPCVEGCEVVTLVDTGSGFRNASAREPLHLSDAMERYLMACVGLRDYVTKNGFEALVLGLSGGADSTLVAAMAVDVFGAQMLNAAMMPSPHTSAGANSRAARLAGGMGGGFNAEVWPITEEYEAAKAAFRRNRGRDMARLADENLQAQIRGNKLSALSNDHGRMAILGTSNKSEILMGYGTLYGDLRAAYNPLKDLYKSIDVFPMLEMRYAQTSVAHPVFDRLWMKVFGRPLAAYTPEAVSALREVIDEPPSAELWPGQVDTDSLPPYPRLDRVLWEIEDGKTSRTDAEIAADLGEPVEFVADIRAKRARPEYKRFQAPPGPKIHRKSPAAKDRRMPLTNRYG